MAKLQLARKAANHPLIRVFLQNSSSAVGAGLTGLTFETAGLTIAFSHGRRYSIDARLVDGATGRALLQEKREIEYLPLAIEKRMAAAAVTEAGQLMRGKAAIAQKVILTPNFSLIRSASPLPVTTPILEHIS
jgi:hypothetical protein